MTRRELAEPILVKLAPSHVRLLEVCNSYPKGESGIFCGKWIKRRCEKQGIPFHQGWLTKLVSVGLLVKDDSSRCGRRRYYRIKEAELVMDVLALARAVQ